MEALIGTVLDQKGHDVHSIQVTKSVYEAIAEMDVRNIGALIVMNERDVVGIITERDYLRKVILKGRSSRETTVESVMSPNLVAITPNDTVGNALAVMTTKRCRHLPVFKGDQLDGLVSVGDLVKTIIAHQEFKIQMLEDYIYRR